MMKIVTKISSTQLKCLVVGLMLGTVFITIPQLATKGAQSDGWAAILIGYLLSLPFALLIIRVLLAFPDKDIFEINQELMGKVLGNLVNIICTLGFLYYTGLIVRIPGLFFTALILPETPAIVFGVSMLFLVVFTLKQGLEVLARFTELVVVFIIGSIIGLLVLATPMFEFNNLQPVLKRGIEPIFLGIKEILGLNFKFILFLGVAVSFVNKGKECYKETIKALAIAVSLLVLITIGVIGIFGGNDPQRFFWPSFQLAKVIEIGGFISGVESMLVGVWTASSFIESSIFFFMTVRGIRHLFQLDSMAGVYWPLALTIGALSMYSHGAFEHSNELYILQLYFVTPLATLMPLVLSIILFFRERSQNDSNLKEETVQNSN